MLPFGIGLTCLILMIVSLDWGIFLGVLRRMEAWNPPEGSGPTRGQVLRAGARFRRKPLIRDDDESWRVEQEKA